MLGKNPKSVSYVVGYGQTYPVHVHHRGASIASVSVLHSSVGCLQGFDTWYRRPKANPNVIHGALVGGPTKNDNFSDDRTNFEQTEPTISASAPLVGLLSKLQSVTAGNSGEINVTITHMYLKLWFLELSGKPWLQLDRYHTKPTLKLAFVP